MFAVISIPDFNLQSALRPHAASYCLPAALIDGTDSNPLICQFTQAARDSGVCFGMTPTQAMARCPKIVIKTRCASQEAAATEALLDCAWTFSPCIEVTSDGVCTLDLKGYGPISYHQLGAKILARLTQLHLAAQIGIAENPLLAWHAARAARPLLVVRDSNQFLSALSVESISPMAEILDVLKKWGIHTLGEFLALGKSAIAERLGPEGLELFERARADSNRPLRLIDPPQTFEEAIEFEYEVETAPALMFVLHRFLEQLSLRLEMLYLVAEELTLRVQLADGTKYEHILKIPAPTCKIETLFGMLETHLETLRTEHPIVGVSLAAKPCRSANQQLELFESALRDPNRFYETLGRLTALAGYNRVGAPCVEPTHRPDAFRLEAPSFNLLAGANVSRSKSVAAVPQARERPTEAEAPRGLCLRRFRPPLAIQIQCRDGCPILISHNSKVQTSNSKLLKERILKIAGPWSLSGNWWEVKENWSRLEWDIQTDSGKVYRLFQQTEACFLDGLYD